MANVVGQQNEGIQREHDLVVIQRIGSTINFILTALATFIPAGIAFGWTAAGYFALSVAALVCLGYLVPHIPGVLGYFGWVRAFLDTRTRAPVPFYAFIVVVALLGILILFTSFWTVISHFQRTDYVHNHGRSLKVTADYAADCFDEADDADQKDLDAKDRNYFNKWIRWSVTGGVTAPKVEPGKEVFIVCVESVPFKEYCRPLVGRVSVASNLQILEGVAFLVRDKPAWSLFDGPQKNHGYKPEFRCLELTADGSTTATVQLTNPNPDEKVLLFLQCTMSEGEKPANKQWLLEQDIIEVH